MSALTVGVFSSFLWVGPERVINDTLFPLLLLFTAILSTGFFGGSTSSASIFSGSPHGDDARGDDACGDDARGDDARGDDARGDDALEEGFAEKFGLVPAFFASVSITFPL